MDLSECFKIGYVAKPHGLKGEVTVVFEGTAAPEADVVVFVEKEGHLIPFVIESISNRVDKSFLKFEDINTPEQAGQFKGCSLFLPKAVRPNLKRGEFYNDEVIGFWIEDKVLGRIGMVKDILQSGPSRLLQVNNDAGKEILIPINGPFIISLSRPKQIIKVDLPEGFLEI